MLVLLTVIGFLPVTLIGAWGIHAAADYQRRELERSMLDQSRALLSAVDAELDGWVDTLRGMSHAPAMAGGDLQAFYTLAREQARAQPDWVGVLLSDARGKLLFKTSLPFGSPEGRIADPDSLSRALATRVPVVGRIAVGQKGIAAFPVRVPVTDAANRFYVLTAAIQPSRVLRVVQRQKIPDGWVISVHDNTGLRVARSRDHERTMGTGPSPTLARLMGTGPEGVGVSHTLEGVEVVTAFSKQSRYGWAVAVGAPTADLRAAWLRSAAVYATAIAASLLLCTALAALIARRTVREMAALQEQAARLGRGQPVDVTPSRIYEVDQMGRALAVAARQRTEHERERGELLASLEKAVRSQDEALARAESASQSKDHFLAVLGHELRNPLSPIVTALDLMEAREQGAYKREREVMRRQVSHLKRLVDDLLDVSRITRGKLELRMEPVDLVQVAGQAVETVRATRSPAPPILARMPARLWVLGDESRLVQVLTNLLSNAVRFGGEGDIELALEQHPGEARVRVSDRGIGMAPELIERIFEPFYQAPQPLARAAGGLGLGLSIVRSIVELHGGRLRADSPGPGLGSTVEVVLPLLAEPDNGYDHGAGGSAELLRGD
ncbi:sensor histidine kinase [Pseudoduganella namucuonensis]|uniref:sensor histidine kinase n=1 Tax=Pseudoduganella namucuonensis TaxID=1035707 RepID=UPI000B8189A3|nr:sensor histidine kinase [Pseudoduganella namucuonensis]